jgi:beta-N-acetylhexosaminidase
VTAAARRRRAALIATALISAAAGLVVGSRAGDEMAVDPPTATAQAECPPEIATDGDRLVGQLLMVRMEARATADLRRAVRRQRLGGVIVFPPEGIAPQALATQIDVLRRVAHRAGAPQPLVAIDQEGGEVKRLPGLAPAQGAPDLKRPAEARFAGTATGEDLSSLGIDVDLAPVLDLAGPDSFISSRAFGTEPATVSASGVAFGEGLQEAGVAATAKHFPGLGLASVNTDEAPTAIEASRRDLAPGLEPFRAAVDADFGLVMAANAVYGAVDPELPASLSPQVIDGLLRERLGFGGVVITDDLGAGAIVSSGFDEGDAALAAARAGADLLLFALSDGSEARRSLLRALSRGKLARAELLDSCARITSLRERLASAPVGPAGP